MWYNVVECCRVFARLWHASPHKSWVQAHVPHSVAVKEPCKEPLNTKSKASMVTCSILALIGKPTLRLVTTSSMG